MSNHIPLSSVNKCTHMCALASAKSTVKKKNDAVYLRINDALDTIACHSINIYNLCSFHCTCSTMFQLLCRRHSHSITTTLLPVHINCPSHYVINAMPFAPSIDVKIQLPHRECLHFWDSVLDPTLKAFSIVQPHTQTPCSICTRTHCELHRILYFHFVAAVVSLFLLLTSARSHSY